MGHDIVIFAVIPLDDEHLRMLELEKEWLENIKKKVPKEYKQIPDELHKYYLTQGCWSDYGEWYNSKLNPRGKRVRLMAARAYNNQKIDLANLPEGTIGIDIIASY